MSKPLPFQWLTGADTPNSLAQQAQANFDALVQEHPDELDITSVIRLGGVGVALQTTGADVTGSFTLPKESNVLLAFTGSGYTGAAGVVAYLNCWVDGVFQGAAGHPFNQSGLQLNMGIFAVTLLLGAGSHSVRLSPGGNLSRDPNDSNTVIYVAFG